MVIYQQTWIYSKHYYPFLANNIWLGLESDDAQFIFQ